MGVEAIGVDGVSTVPGKINGGVLIGVDGVCGSRSTIGGVDGTVADGGAEGAPPERKFAGLGMKKSA